MLSFTYVVTLGSQHPPTFTSFCAAVNESGHPSPHPQVCIPPPPSPSHPPYRYLSTPPPSPSTPSTHSTTSPSPPAPPASISLSPTHMPLSHLRIGGRLSRLRIGGREAYGRSRWKLKMWRSRWEEACIMVISFRSRGANGPAPTSSTQTGRNAPLRPVCVELVGAGPFAVIYFVWWRFTTGSTSWPRQNGVRWCVYVCMYALCIAFHPGVYLPSDRWPRHGR